MWWKRRKRKSGTTSRSIGRTSSQRTTCVLLLSPLSCFLNHWSGLAPANQTLGMLKDNITSWLEPTSLAHGTRPYGSFPGHANRRQLQLLCIPPLPGNAARMTLDSRGKSSNYLQKPPFPFPLSPLATTMGKQKNVRGKQITGLQREGRGEAGVEQNPSRRPLKENCGRGRGGHSGDNEKKKPLFLVTTHMATGHIGFFLGGGGFFHQMAA
ncbi:hypothetical protein LX36DRAFT_393791 [Colletotrichum falcatum]|nr:hypothetical protein LX36DRAFT_393791 [Colletotrichum falcatum]